MVRVSTTTPEWQTAEPSDTQPVASPLEFPEEWTLSTSWERAQIEADQGGPITDAERVVWLSEGDPHRVVFVLDGATLRARCSCDGWHYRDWCAHVASCWWRWCTGAIAVTHEQTGREYCTPPKWLRFYDDRPGRDQLDGLTAAELDAYLTCELAHVGVREYARKTGRAPGTVGNLLARAREKAHTPTPHAGGGEA